MDNIILVIQLKSPYYQNSNVRTGTGVLINRGMGREGDGTLLKCSTSSHFNLLYIICLTFRNSVTKQPVFMSDFFVTEIDLQLLKDLFLPQFILAVTSSGYSVLLFLLKEKSAEVTVAIFSSFAP